MRKTSVAIIGGGQAGLAMSHCLTAAGIDHLVIERDRVGSRWRGEAFAAGRLLTPNWMTRLPGWVPDAANPSGFMRFSETAAMLGRYARAVAAPVIEECPVDRLTPDRDGYRLLTGIGTILARAVVIATGHCQFPLVPSIAAALPGRIAQFTAANYRDPECLPPGGVLVVGASATGVQIADELARAGRDVVLAAGGHTRLPRRWRGRDIFHWLDRAGILDEATAGTESIKRPSLQLAGTTRKRAPDLPSLAARGVTLAGRLAGIDGLRVGFGGDLPANCAAADRRLARTLDRIDAAIAGAGLIAPREARPAAFAPGEGPRELRLDERGIASVVWAVGYGRSYPWLDAPALDCAGELVHSGGVTRLPGLYALGLSHMRRRKSAFIDGVGDDARELAARIACLLARPSRRAA